MPMVQIFSVMVGLMSIKITICTCRRVLERMLLSKRTGRDRFCLIGDGRR